MSTVRRRLDQRAPHPPVSHAGRSDAPAPAPGRAEGATPRRRRRSATRNSGAAVEHLSNAGFDLDRAPVIRPGAAPLGSTRGLFDRKYFVPGVRVVSEVLVPQGKEKQGEPVVLHANQHQGVLKGVDGRGRAVILTDEGKLVHTAFKRVAPVLEEGQTAADLRAAAVNLDALEGIPAERRHPLDPRVREALQLALQRPVLDDPELGTRTAGDFVKALTDAGHEVFCFGGAGGRDALELMARKPDATAEEIAETFADLDIQTDASAEALDAICARLGEGFPNQGLWTNDYTSKRYGVWGVGERKHGVDLVRLKGGQDERGASIFTRLLREDALTPDFEMNNLRIRLTGEPDDWELIDPSGKGIEDAVARRLTLVGDRAETDRAVAFRAIKFIARGCELPDETRVALTRNIERFWPEMKSEDDGARWVNDLFRNLKADSVPALEEELEGFRQAMERVGWGDTYRDYFEPLKGQIFDEFTRRQFRKVHVDEPVQLFDHATSYLSTLVGTSFEGFHERFDEVLRTSIVDEVVARYLKQAEPQSVIEYAAEVDRVRDLFDARDLTDALERLPAAVAGYPLKDFVRARVRQVDASPPRPFSRLDTTLEKLRTDLVASGLSEALPILEQMESSLWGEFRHRAAEAREAARRTR
jgi:hypothetical protein